MKGMHRTKYFAPRTDEQLREWILAHFRRNPITECWWWKLNTDKDGYGSLCVNSKKTRVHREAYRLFVGEIPSGLLVLHSCDNPVCINPDHLFLGTYADNRRDMCLKGRNRNVCGEQVHGVKLTERQVLEARRLYKEGFKQRELARMFNVNIATMNPLLRGKTWKHLSP
jgi:HNH endonuclease